MPQIHGLGGSNSSSTLVVIDGHRFPLTGIIRNLPDPNFIPPNAIERVRCWPRVRPRSTAPDAVAGVLNFITRRRFQGIEASAQYGFGEDYSTWNAGIALGQRWDSGRHVGVLQLFEPRQSARPGPAAHQPGSARAGRQQFRQLQLLAGKLPARRQLADLPCALHQRHFQRARPMRRASRTASPISSRRNGAIR